MEILKNLLQNGERIGVLVNDGGETYPIPMEGLKSEVAYNELKKAGYALTDVTLPEYMKNGKTISSLPSEEWNPSIEDSMAFFNYTTQFPAMAMKDLYALLEVKAAALDFKEGDYRIKTRAEFMEYIDSIKFGVRDDDFMPVNSFVAPEARFTVEEIFSDYHISAAMDILEKRRRYSMHRFISYCDKVKAEKGIAAITPTALIDAYLEYGLDGVNAVVVARSNENTTADPFTTAPHVDPNAPELYKGYFQFSNALTQFVHRDTVLVNNNRDSIEGTLFAGDLPGTEVIHPISDTYRRNPVFWTDLDVLAETHAGLSPNSYMTETVLIPYSQLVRTWTLDNGDRIIITDEKCGIIRRRVAGAINMKCWDNFCKRNPNNFNRPLPLSLWFNEDSEYATKSSKLRVLAERLFERVSIDCDDTTFSILIEMGLTPGLAIRYIANKGGFLGRVKFCGEESEGDGKSHIMPAPDLDLYLSDDDILNYFKTPDDPSVLSSYFYDTADDSLITNGSDPAAIQLAANNPDRYGIITAERKIEIIHDIIMGNLDIGEISNGHRADDSMTIDAIYDNLCAAHFILNIPIENIESTLDNLSITEERLNTSSSMTVYLQGDTKELVFELNFRNNAVRAARALRGQLKADQVQNAPVFFTIIDVAKELHNGSVDNENIARRHVAFAGVCIDTNSDVLNADRTKVKHVPNEAVISTLHAMQEEAYAYLADQKMSGFTASESFAATINACNMSKIAALDMVMFGTVKTLSPDTYPDAWSTPSAERIAALKSGMRRIYDTTMAVCDDYIDFLGEKDEHGVYQMSWNYYCVNADITPTLITPKGSFLIPETEIRAVFFSDMVNNNYEGLMKKNLLATNSYFVHSGPNCTAWEYADFTGQHICDRAHEYLIGDGLLATSACYKDTEVYTRMGACIPDDIREAVAEERRHSQRHERVSAWSLARYMHESYATLNIANERGMFFNIPTHPAEMLYNYFYGTDKFFMREAKEGDKMYFPMEDGSVLVGPTYNVTGDVIFGRQVRPAASKTRLRIANASVNEDTDHVKALTGFSSYDMQRNRELVERNFAVGKRFTVNSGNISIDGKPLTVSEVTALDRLEYAIEHIDGRTAIICSTDNILYRVTE